MTATLLNSGKVLVVGGVEATTSEKGIEGADGPALSSSELYDPETGRWTRTGSLTTGRISHTATLLADGRVLVLGGGDGSTEIYDPTTGKWTVRGSVATPRTFHTVTLLKNGKVLVAGGFTSTEGRNVESVAATSGAAFAKPELYDPKTGNWSSVGSAPKGRYLHTATPLKNGHVLIVGGVQETDDPGKDGVYGPAMEYDPNANSWTPRSDAGGRRQQHKANLLDSGEVLVVGGVGAVGGAPGDPLAAGGLTATTELYDPDSDTWGITEPLPFAQPTLMTAILKNGDVLVFASPLGRGDAPRPEPVRAFTYDGATDDGAPGKWTTEHDATDGTAPRTVATATVLKNGRVLVLDGAAATTRLYTPASLRAGGPPWQWVSLAAVVVIAAATTGMWIRRRSRRGTRRAAPVGGGFGSAR